MPKRSQTGFKNKAKAVVEKLDGVKLSKPVKLVERSVENRLLYLQVSSPRLQRLRTNYLLR